MATEYTTERQDRNGVRVTVHHWEGGGRTVEAKCGCFGHPYRAHTTMDCPYLRKQMKEKGVSNGYVVPLASTY